MEINLNISGATVGEIQNAMRDLLNGLPSAVPVVGNVGSFQTSEPEIVPPAKKGRGKAKPNKAEDITDIDANGDPVGTTQNPGERTTSNPGNAPTTEPTSEGPKHDEARIAAREFNAKFGSDALIDLLKQFKNDKGEPCSGPRELFRCGHADAFLAAVKAKMSE